MSVGNFLPFQTEHGHGFSGTFCVPGLLNRPGFSITFQVSWVSFFQNFRGFVGFISSESSLGWFITGSLSNRLLNLFSRTFQVSWVSFHQNFQASSVSFVCPVPFLNPAHFTLLSRKVSAPFFWSTWTSLFLFFWFYYLTSLK